MPPRKRLFGLRGRAAKASGSSEQEQPNKSLHKSEPGFPHHRPPPDAHPHLIRA
jgi:hypothetical protein